MIYLRQTRSIIEIANRSLLVAPASATIAKLASGFADNMMTSTASLLPITVKSAIPAMNTKIYEIQSQ